MKEKIKVLLRPTKPKVFLFSLLAVLVFIGSIQGWVFSNPEITGTPKPWLCDIVKDWPPMWPLASLLLLPLTPLHVLLMFILNREVGGNLYFCILGVPYLYLLSSIFVQLFIRVRAKLGNRNHVAT
jgi:hypothetical protein